MWGFLLSLAAQREFSITALKRLNPYRQRASANEACRVALDEKKNRSQRSHRLVLEIFRAWSKPLKCSSEKYFKPSGPSGRSHTVECMYEYVFITNANVLKMCKLITIILPHYYYCSLKKQKTQVWKTTVLMCQRAGKILINRRWLITPLPI